MNGRGECQDERECEGEESRHDDAGCHSDDDSNDNGGGNGDDSSDNSDCDDDVYGDCHGGDGDSKPAVV